MFKVWLSYVKLSFSLKASVVAETLFCNPSDFKVLPTISVTFVSKYILFFSAASLLPFLPSHLLRNLAY